MRTGSFTKTELGEVKFPEITTPILEKVIQYFYYKLRYQNSCVLCSCLSCSLLLVHPLSLCLLFLSVNAPWPSILKHCMRQSIPTSCRTTKNIPEFKVEPQIALELLMAANFLGESNVFLAELYVCSYF